MPSQGFIPIDFNVGPWSAQKKPPPMRGLLLVSDMPPSGRHRGRGTVTVGAWVAGPMASPTSDYTLGGPYSFVPRSPGHTISINNRAKLANGSK